MCPGLFIREANSPLVPVCVMGLNAGKGKMGFGKTRCLSPVYPIGLCLSLEERSALQKLKKLSSYGLCVTFGDRQC